jgi:hypothetical protein
MRMEFGVRCISSGRPDLNRGPPAPEAGALTGLRYAPCVRGVNVIGRSPFRSPARVAVAVFINRTGDPALESLDSMAADWVTRGLTHPGGPPVRADQPRGVTEAAPLKVST